jgi:hypothetical protein
MVAVPVVIILAGGLVWDIKTTPPTYEESTTVVFMAPGGNPYATLGSELIPMANLMTATITSTKYLGKIRAAGGSAAADIAMVNLYNEQFPQYGVPYVTISTESSDPAAVSRTFDIIIETLRNLVSTRQTEAAVPRWSRVSIRLVGDSGVRAPDGSHIRVLFGLAVLTLMALFVVVVFLDRRRSQRAPYDRRLPLGVRVRSSSLIT